MDNLQEDLICPYCDEEILNNYLEYNYTLNEWNSIECPYCSETIHYKVHTLFEIEK